ncbi:MAG: hypothetical protein MJK15_03045 [Colwellia sp.]|nr:hypothetical protein [Colwellia sp.]
MNKSNAKKIAEVITFDQLQVMFANAKNNVKDWHKISNVNHSLTIGTTWNILFTASTNPSIIKQKSALTNMIWEFGDYLPEELLPKKGTIKKAKVKVTHQEPKF